MGGFCWQGASLIAGKLSLDANSPLFALITGAGDMFGVCFGHIA